MASHYVAIAKASLAAALLRPDPAPVSRDEISRLHKLLDGAILQCSPSKIQICKEWLLDNIIPSSARITAFGKYLTALSTSFEKAKTNDGNEQIVPSSGTSVRRKRLHVLYLINDILHHARYHTRNSSSHILLSSGLQSQLVQLLSLAASFDKTTSPKFLQKLLILLNVWQDHKYYGSDYIDKLREAIQNASSTGVETKDKNAVSDASANGVTNSTSAQKEAPFVMPSHHGDPSTPYYDLPAGNMLPHIVPNSASPIHGKLMKPLQFVAGPAEDYLKRAVKDFLDEIASINQDTWSNEEKMMLDIDEMGQPLVKDEITGEMNPKEAYYGWSISFCERMKKRKLNHSDSVPQNRDRERSRSSSRSPNPRKRREYTTSNSSGGSRSRSPRNMRRGRRRSYSRSRSRSRHSPLRGRRESRSQSPQHPLRRSAPSFSTSTSNYDNPPPLQTHSYAHSIPQPPLTTPIDQIDNPIPHFAPPAPSQRNQQPHNFPLGPGGLPVPPPPPFHNGPWPPAMPQSMPATFQPRTSLPGFGRGALPDLRGFVPPPPPPQSMNSGQQGVGGGLASPMPLWPGSQGPSQDRAIRGSLEQQQEQDYGSRSRSYQQNQDSRRR